MVHYIHVSADGHGLGTWETTETRVRRTDGANTEYPRPSNVDVIKNIESTVPFSNVHELKLAPGEYFSRIARPSSAHPHESPGYCPDNIQNQNLVSEALGQLNALRDQMERICRVVHPVISNFATYGHETRNLLILASTEAEAQWKGVLRAHRSKAESTKDYVKLASALRLSEYRIALAFYPWLEPIEPFRNWTSTSKRPTKDLSWYDAYNAVKHDRENEFSRATLEHTIQAVAACVVMVCAQFGWGFSIANRADLRSYFTMVAAPDWEPSEVYTPLLSANELTFPTPLIYKF
jgi:hypothetical protein